jgi:hypothetical protein
MLPHPVRSAMPTCSAPSPDYSRTNNDVARPETNVYGHVVTAGEELAAPYAWRGPRGTVGAQKAAD